MVNLRAALSRQVNMTTSSSAEELTYTCPDCGNVVKPYVISVLGETRYIKRKCDCVLERVAKEAAERMEIERRERINRLFNLAELGPRFSECTFESWIPRRGAERCFELAKEYADNFDEHARRGDGLLLMGEPGNGKTHLAAAIVNHLVLRGKTCVFRSVPALLKRLQETYREGSRVTESEVLAVLQDADLLVLDDLGAEKVTEWAESTLYFIVDERYRWKKPLVVTTNCRLEVLEERIGTRTIDRLLEMCTLVENRASSYRRERAKERLGRAKP